MSNIAKLRDAPEPAAERGSAHARLAAARVQLHNGGIKKTGTAPNRRGGYFELGDFIVPAQVALRDNGLIGVVSYGGGVASLEIVNIDDSSDRIRIESPLGSAKLPNCHEVQNIGAVQTYQRRYLWMTALEIVEHDALEGSDVDDTPPASKTVMPDHEWAKLVQLVEATNTNVPAMLSHLRISVANNNLRLLNQDQYAAVVEALNTKLAKLVKAETDAKAAKPTLAEELGDAISF